MAMELIIVLDVWSRSKTMVFDELPALFPSR